MFTACEALHAVAQWIDQQDDNDPTVANFAERYQLKDLRLSESKYVPSSFAARLAIAIASAEHTVSGTDNYVANDALALSASYYYGLFLRAIKSKSGKASRRQAVEYLNKLLISKDF